MRITLLGNTELPYSSETYYVKTLTHLGHDVKPLFESEASGETVLEEALKSDLFVWIHGHSETTPGRPMKEVLKVLKRMGVTTMTWHHDLFFGLARQKEIEDEAVYKYIQHFFTTDKLMANWVNKNTRVKAYYLPSAVYHEEAYMVPPGGEDRKDVVFVGNKGYHPEWSYRPQLIDWLQETYKDRFGWYSGEEDSLGLKRDWEMNQLFADSKIVIGDSLCLNFNYPYYWSDRTWETLGRGGFLIQPYIKGMEKYFQDRMHLAFYHYGDFDGLETTINYYLDTPHEREAIRLAGHKLVRNNHTYVDRWRQILQTLGFDAKEWNGYYA